jgi:hypothetical protein
MLHGGNLGEILPVSEQAADMEDWEISETVGSPVGREKAVPPQDDPGNLIANKKRHLKAGLVEQTRRCQ